MFRLTLSYLFLALCRPLVQGFVPSHVSLSTPRQSVTAPIYAVSSSSYAEDAEHDASTDTPAILNMDRRQAFRTAAVLVLGGSAFTTTPVQAADGGNKKVVVAGATGQTGRRILERLAATKGLYVVGGVRNVDKATKSLAESSTVIRGAMVQQVQSVDTSQVDLQRLDVVQDSVDALTSTLQGADSLIIAAGFTPGLNPLKWSEGIHSVDNVGVSKLIDAAQAAGVRKVVLITSILTNGRAWGQENAAGFVATNAIGGALDEKLITEKHLRASGLDWTIVRPGGLKSQPPSGALVVSGEDTLNSGEISRDLVAEVCIASISDPKASKKVLEIFEDEGKPPAVFNGLKM